MLNFLKQVSETTPTAQFIIGEGPAVSFQSWPQ